MEVRKLLKIGGCRAVIIPPAFGFKDSKYVRLTLVGTRIIIEGLEEAPHEL